MLTVRFYVLFLISSLLLSGGASGVAAKNLVELGTNSERLAYHLDSWLSLIIIVSALLISVALNHTVPAIRTMGAFLTAVGCFILVGWFGFVVDSGILDNPRPVRLPVDGAKPALLWIQALTFLLTGIFLLLGTFWQSKRRDRLALPVTNKGTYYGRLSRYLHWTTAILILILIPMGIFTSMIPDDVWYRQGYYVVHKTVGLTVLVLVLMRLLWRLSSPIPALDPSLKIWERRLAHCVHIMMFVFMLAFPLTGFILSTYVGKLSHFFIWDVPLFWAPDEKMTMFFALLHKVLLPYIFYLFIGIHVIGALKHRFVDQHINSLRRMVS